MLKKQKKLITEITNMKLTHFSLHNIIDIQLAYTYLQLVS